jgi:hypothetical protein
MGAVETTGEKRMTGKLWKGAAVGLAGIVSLLIGVIYAKDTTNIDTALQRIDSVEIAVASAVAETSAVKQDIAAIKVQVESLTTGQNRIEKKVDDAFEKIIILLQRDSARGGGR